MEAFSGEWLAAREPADHAARAEPLVAVAIEALAARGTGAGVSIIDLAAGTGSNLRYLSRRLPFPQHWWLVDHDAALLAAAGRVAVSPGVTISTLRADLALLDEALFHDGRRPLLVTASALLDLTSIGWLDALAGQCRAVDAVALFALTYDGRIDCKPADPVDEIVRALVNRHQLKNKGFGPAAGPGAADAAAQAFERHGFKVHRAASDWELGAESRALQRQLMEGWAAAAVETSPRDASVIEGWLARRRSAIEKGTSRIDVGHQDLVALP